MASYEFNDAVIDEVLGGGNLCEIAEQNLIDLLGDSPETEGRSFSGPLTKFDFRSLRIDAPEVLVFDVAGGAADKLKVNLGKIPASERSEIKGIVFDTDRSVTLEGLGDFGGVIGLGDGNDRVSARSSTKDITICTGGGNDSVRTGSGNDSINIGSGKDTVSTGAGNDKIAFTGIATGGNVKAGSGNDDILFTSGFSGGQGVRITLDGGADNDRLNLGSLEIAAVKKAGSGVRITLADQTVVVVKNVESFSYLDNGQVKTVGVQEFNDAFPDFPLV